MNFQIAIYLCLSALPLSWALQATPNSNCSSLCVDFPTQNSSDTHTFEKNITCSDSKFWSTDIGKKFEKCNSCLLNSTFDDGGISDQSTLMYNLRATVDYCLWGFPNASSNVSSPCNINYGCEPLKDALTYDNLDTSNTTEWGYCTADGGAFLGENLAPCIECFQATTDETYIANFLIALEAGCQQKPGPGQTIGLTGSLFSKTAVNITTVASTSATQPQSNGIKVGTVVGIAIGGVLLVVAAIAFGIVFFRKRRADNIAMLQLKSDYDTRYGSQDISAPTAGGFAQPPTPRSINDLPDYERRAQNSYGTETGGERLSDEPGIPRNLYTAAWLATPSRSDAMPAHPAYLSQEHVKTPPPQSRPGFKNSKSPALSPRRDDVGLTLPTKTKTTTFEPGLDYEAASVYEMRSPSVSGSRYGLVSPGLPATPKAGIFAKFGGLGKSQRPVPPKTPNDIWN